MITNGSTSTVEVALTGAYPNPYTVTLGAVAEAVYGFSAFRLGTGIEITWLTAANQSVPENAGFSMLLETSVTCIFTVVGGADAARFSIANETTVDFAPQDYESPNDANSDGVYELVIRATSVDFPDSYADRAFHITVLDVEDASFWSPEVYRNNQMAHWDAANNPSLEITDTGRVSALADLSPKLRHAIQLVDLNRVLYVAESEVSGLPALRSITASPDTWLEYTTWARDIDGLQAIVVGSDLTLQMGQHFAEASLRSLQKLPVVVPSVPHVFTFIWTATTWKWRMDGVDIDDGAIPDAFFEDELPEPGMFFMVASVRTGGGGNNSRLFEMGHIFSTYGSSSSTNRNADMDLSELYYISNAVEP